MEIYKSSHSGQEVDEILQQVKNKANKSEVYLKSETDEKIDGKVDKVTGKGLSSNDFTDDDKSKLDGLSNYDDTEIIRLISEEATARSTADEGKVDKVSGKGLSTNDLTDVLLERLNNQTFDGTIESQQEGIYDEWMSPDIDNLDTGIYRVIDLSGSNGNYAYHNILFNDREDGSGHRALFDGVRVKYAFENSDGWDDWQYLYFVDVKEHLNSKQNPHSVTKAQIGLENVDNTSDVNKPISTAVQTALDGKADKTEVAENDNALKLDIKTLKAKSIPHTTASGYPISLTDHLNEEQVIDYKIYGNSVQDGTPSTDSPVEIQSVGDLVTDETSEYYGKYDVSVKANGKNLFDMNQWGIFTQQEDGSYKYNKTQGISVDSCAIDFSLPEGIYTMSYQLKCPVSTNVRVAVIYEDGKRGNQFIASTGEYVQFAFTTNGKAIKKITLHYGGITNDVSIRDFQLEKGTTATEYEPYKGETKHIYLDEPLRKIGDYADYIDYKNQNVVRKIEVLDDTGTKTIDESLGVLDTPTTEVITVPDLITPNSGITNIFASTSTQPSSIDVTYYQDINKIITELKNAILAQGGNV